MATLLGEWGFLDNLADTSGNGHTATVSGFTPSFVDGPTSGTRAIVLNTSTARVIYGRTGLEPAQADGGVVTMAWVKLNASHADYTDAIAKMQAFDSTRHALWVGDNHIESLANWRGREAYNNNAGDLSDNDWHHVCLVDGNDRWQVYFDGVSAGSGGASTGSFPA